MYYNCVINLKMEKKLVKEVEKHFINLNYLNKSLKKIKNFILKYQKIDNVCVIELRKFIICYKIYKF